MPHPDDIDRVVAETGMGRVQAYHHLKAREALKRSGQWLARRWS